MPSRFGRKGRRSLCLASAVTAERAVLLVIVSAAGIARAQPAESGNAQRLVKLNVVATGAKGEPVTDLKASEVHIKEDGQPRHLDFFRSDGLGRPTLAPAPGEFANRPGPSPTVILLDRWNELMMTTAVAGDELVHAIRNLETTDGVYLYVLTLHGDLYPVRAIPDTESDARAAPPPSALELASRLADALKKLSGFRDMDKDDPAIRFNLTSAAFTSLGEQMTAMSGRKSLIWVTHGVPRAVSPVSAGDFTPLIRQLGMASAEAGVVVYPVDQSGSGAGAVPDESRITLNLIAGETGGRWYPSDNIDRAVAVARADARSNYILAYHTPIPEKDKKYHKIRLSSSRKGVNLQTRDGYPGYFPPPQADALEEAMVRAARRSPFDASEIGLRVAVSASPKLNATHFRIRIDLADVLLMPDANHYRGQLSVYLVAYNEGFLNGSASRFDLDLDLTEEQFQAAAKDGLVISPDIHVPDQGQKARVIVYDRALQSVGSVTIPVIPHGEK